MNKTIADYREELIKNYVIDEGKEGLNEKHIRSYVQSLDNVRIFKELKIEPDEYAIARAEVDEAIKQDNAKKKEIVNHNHERLSKLKGTSRIAAIMEMKEKGETDSMIAGSPKSQLQSGRLTGADRIAMALNAQSNS